MKKIKYRIWSHELSTWITDLFIENLVDYKSGEYTLNRLFEEILSNKNTSINQCSGMPDRNQTFIYEGDIIEVDGVIGIVTYFAGIFFCEFDDQTDTELAYLAHKELLVIGNIYDKRIDK